VLEVKRNPAKHSHDSKTPATPGRKDDLVSTGERQLVSRQLSSFPVSSSPEARNFQTKMPVITGEVHFKGVASIEGLLTGQMGPGSGLNLKQKCSSALISQPELQGEISFKEMVRVNGHIAGTVYSQSGTLIVDTGAHVEASVDFDGNSYVLPKNLARFLSECCEIRSNADLSKATTADA
jgi:cytoskeletal protein CcmA (bactofilin family)